MLQLLLATGVVPIDVLKSTKISINNVDNISECILDIYKNKIGSRIDWRKDMSKDIDDIAYSLAKFGYYEYNHIIYTVSAGNLSIIEVSDIDDIVPIRIALQIIKYDNDIMNAITERNTLKDTYAVR